jgi:hydrogenase nickel incorporation protein HypA/HybF
MHEYSIAADIAEIVAQTAAGRPVKKISLAIGALSGVFSDSLLMYLDLVLSEMGMHDVAVEAKDVPASFICSCGTHYSAERMTAVCPACGGFERTITSGKDCTVESIEVEDD